MIKLSVAIAGSNAQDSAFVVYRGFEESIKKAAELGYDGVELALKDASEIDPSRLAGWLSASDMEVSCISTGQVFADLGLTFTDPDPDIRAKVRAVFIDLIDLAADFGRMVNIGRVRGQIDNGYLDQAETRFVKMAHELCAYAGNKGVTIVLEPVNRYETNFINHLEEGVDLIKMVNRPNMKLMPDTFHMNIEDPAIGDELAKHIEHVEYIHFADSNRLAPGCGHMDFEDILKSLKSVDYSGWVAVEILPEPDPDTAAGKASEFLRPLIDKYNEQ